MVFSFKTFRKNLVSTTNKNKCETLEAKSFFKYHLFFLDWAKLSLEAASIKEKIASAWLFYNANLKIPDSIAETGNKKLVHVLLDFERVNIVPNKSLRNGRDDDVGGRI